MTAIDTDRPTVRLLGESGVGACGVSLRSGDAHVLLDAGLDIGDSVQDVEDAPDAVVITHAHLDHCGAIPELVFSGTLDLFGPPQDESPDVWASPRTKSLLPAAFTSIEGMSEARARAAARRVREAPMTKWWSPTGDERGPHAILFPAGHIAGAASILVQMEGRHLYYTGDLCTHDQPVTSGAEVPPVGDVNVDLLVTESILGDRSDLAEVDIAAAWSRFREVVRSASGSVLVAAAPMGLAQEVLAALAGDVDRLYAHEQLQSATETYGRRDDETSREFVASVESCPETELRSLLNGANVIVAPGSQCQRGTAAGRLAERAVSSPNSTVVLLRDCYDRHLGGKLQRVERNAVEASDIEVSGRRVDVRCRTKTVVLPNHGPPDQLVSVAEHLQPTSIWCVHGADRARRDLRSRLHEALPGAAVQLPEAGNTEEIA